MPIEQNEQKKIKVVIGINDFRIGGAQRLVANLAQRFDASAFELHLITLMQYEHEPSFYDVLPASIVVHKMQFRGFRDVPSWRKLLLLLRDIKPDIVWSQLFFSNTIFRVLKPLVGYQTIATEQNVYANKTFLQRFVDRLLAHMTATIVAVSQDVADYTSRQERIPKEKFTLIHNGVDVEKLRNAASVADVEAVRREFNMQPSERLIVNVGQLIHQKNQLLLLDAFSAFRPAHSNYKLVILGEGSMRSTLEARIHELGLRDCVFVPGIRKNVAAYYSASDFFVLSSRFEGFCTVIIEAMACGLPVVSTRVAGSNESIVDGRNGFFADDTAESLAGKMSHLACLSEKEQTSFTLMARDTAAAYDISLIASRYMELFRSIFYDKTAA